MRTRSLHSGFTLVEALVALVVMAFGMLALTSLQLSLSRNADMAKQRTEAMRLAQDRIERLRSYDGIDSGTVQWNALASGSQNISSYTIGGVVTNTNTSYAVAWTLGGTTSDPYRPATVQVSWTDRTNAAQSISLSTIIAKTDPEKVGALGFPMPQNSTIKRPKNRNLNIPMQAIDLGGGESAYRLSSSYSVVFNDITGGVIRICTALDATGSNYDKSAGVAGNFGTANCRNVNGYIVAGYVSGNVDSISLLGVTTPTMPSGINTTGITGATNPTDIKCTYRQATNTNSNASISGYHYYLCVIPVPSYGSPFSGTIRLGGVNTLSSNKVCRVEYASSAYVTAGERNVQPYANVTMSLDNQNYYVESSNGNGCPTITSVSGVTGGSVATVLHQDCRSNQAPTTTSTGTCPASTHNTGV